MKINNRNEEKCNIFIVKKKGEIEQKMKREE